MRIGIDAHIILPQHKRYDPVIARYTENLISHLIEADKKQEHTWVLFFDERMKGMKKMKKYDKPNVIIKHFPFIQYRKYLPVVYSHMLISSFIATARLQVFHSPEGLVPYLYPGKIVTTFYYVPRGKSESNLFVRTFMLGARIAFARLCKRAKRIIVNKGSDKSLLVNEHGCSNSQVVVMEADDIERVAWTRRVKELLAMYSSVVNEKERKKEKKRREKMKKKEAKRKIRRGGKASRKANRKKK